MNEQDAAVCAAIFAGVNRVDGDDVEEGGADAVSVIVQEVSVCAGVM